MNFYVGSIVVSIIFKIITQIRKITYKVTSSEKINYLDIGKYNVANKKTLSMEMLINMVINLLTLLIPGINLFVYGYGLYRTGNKGIRRRETISRENMFSIAKVISVYENQKSIEESFKIDGLSKKEIKKEVKLANEELGYTYITDRMYKDIKASKEAIDYLKNIENNDNLDLSRKDKIKLLREYRKVFTSGSKEFIKPLEKLKTKTSKSV